MFLSVGTIFGAKINFIDALNTDTVQGSAGATNYRRNNVLHSQFVKGQTPSFQDNTDKHWTIWKDFFDVSNVSNWEIESEENQFIANFTRPVDKDFSRSNNPLQNLNPLQYKGNSYFINTPECNIESLYTDCLRFKYMDISSRLAQSLNKDYSDSTAIESFNAFCIPPICGIVQTYQSQNKFNEVGFTFFNKNYHKSYNLFLKCSK